MTRGGDWPLLGAPCEEPAKPVSQSAGRNNQNVARCGSGRDIVASVCLYLHPSVALKHPLTHLPAQPLMLARR